jgi:hypothetical protein
MKKDKKVAIDYSAREFSTIKDSLVRHAKRYYPEQFQDFNEAGFGSLMLDTVAYVGDMLSFYLDYQANETFLETAIERDNVIKLARQLGYKYENTMSSSGIATFYIFIPATTDGLGPDSRYIPVLRKNSTFSARNGIQYILSEDVRFDGDDNEVAVGRINETTGLPTYYAIKSSGVVISGRYSTATVSVGDFTKFLRIELPLNNVVEIISVKDAQGFEYYEVESLSQDFIYRPVLNRSSTSSQVQSLLRPYYVPRRFVVEKLSNSTFLQFGHGYDESLTEDISIADPSGVVLKYEAKNYISDTSVDPSRLVYSDKFGIVPVNTTLSITARINDQQNVNIASNTLTQINNAIFDFNNLNNLDQTVVSFIRNSLEVNNESAIIGSTVSLETNHIKKLAMNSMSSQNRAVTLEDYKGLIYKMPAKFGSVRRVNVLRDQNSFKRNLNIYVISENQQGFLENSSLTLKENLKVWLNNNKMINDTIDILDAKIVNLGINFQFIADNTTAKEDVLVRALSRLRAEFARKPDIGESFFITDVYKILRDTKGVLDVVSVNVFVKTGANYSNIGFDLEQQKSTDGRYIAMPDNVIYEIKYLESDIKGAVI